MRRKAKQLGLDTEAKAFLGQFPDAFRGEFASWFHGAVQSGVRIPDEILKYAIGKARARWLNSDSPDDARAFGRDAFGALALDPEGALRYARYVLTFETLLPAERAQIRAEQQRERDNQPPTAEQIAFIQARGRARIPNTRGDAEKVIERLRRHDVKHGKAKRGASRC